MTRSENIMTETELHAAHNYRPLPVVLVRGRGVYAYDPEGNWYLDMLAGFSSINFGHLHPRIVAAVNEQLTKIGVVPGCFYNEHKGTFSRMLGELTGLKDIEVLAANGGAEAVETAIKIARKWAYKKKGVLNGRAKIIFCYNNFHGRTLAVISASSTDQYRDGFGPFLSGFELIPFGDLTALEHAIDENTAAFIVEPIQGEGGINVSPKGYIGEAFEICRQRNVLFVPDEIQTCFGRTGKNFAYMHDDVKPDMVILGKSLGGGVYPVSAVVARKDVMEVIGPGDHGSTFGGNPVACAIGIEAMKILVEENLAERTRELGEEFLFELQSIKSPYIKEVRGRGLMIGIELNENAGGARRFCEALLEKRILCVYAGHNTVIRFTPPLVITREELTRCADETRKVLSK